MVGSTDNRRRQQARLRCLLVGRGCSCHLTTSKEGEGKETLGDLRVGRVLSSPCQESRAMQGVKGDTKVAGIQGSQGLAKQEVLGCPMIDPGHHGTDNGGCSCMATVALTVGPTFLQLWPFDEQST
jgi:hypothetical protein